ncbi:MAG: arginine--tRNA ligase [Beijerinckiaceae bacterium]
MNLFADYQAKVVEIIEGLSRSGRLPVGLNTARVVVEPPRDAGHGDFATNAAMVLARDAGMKPRDLAEMLVAELVKDSGVVKADIAGPGFINVALKPALFDAVILNAVALGEEFGRSTLGGGKKVNIEYVSANPTGPMHVGHCRGAVFGDALANLMAFAGYDVTREYYINDAGSQVDVLARSVHLRYREALGEDIGAIPEGLYPGDYLKPVGAMLAKAHGAALLDLPEASWLPMLRTVVIDAMMVMIREDLKALTIEHAVFFSENSLHALRADGSNISPVGEAIADLRARDLIYEGRLPPPKGAPEADWEDREQTLFRSSSFGDDVDRPLMKSDGSYTYFASDIAYHRDKYLRGFSIMIDVWGADHGGYIKRMKAAVKAITGGEGSLDIEICQLVKLLRDGVEVKMSKRAGTFVTLREVVDEVGPDPVRFMMLFRKNDAPLEFDLAKVLEQSKENPVFYVQYAFARSHSIFRQARLAFGADAFGLDELAKADISRLTDDAERALIGQIAQYPRLVEAAASSREPHRVAFYLYELASGLHSLWNRGKENADLRFVNDKERESTLARLALVCSLIAVLGSGLRLLGVSAPEEMR